MFINVGQFSSVKRVYIPIERSVVNDDDNSLGFLKIKIGKMFHRAFKFTPKSFRFKNIMGSVGSVFSNYMTLGLASAIAPKTFSAHSKAMRQVGMGVTAAAAAAGAVIGGSALLSSAGAVGASGAGGASGATGGLLGTASKIGSGLMTGLNVATKAMPIVQLFSGKGSYVIPQAEQQGVMVYSPGTPSTNMNMPEVIGQASLFPPSYFPTPYSDANVVSSKFTQPSSSGEVSPWVGGDIAYDGSGGTVDQGLIKYDTGKEIITGVPNTYTYIGLGVVGLSLLTIFYSNEGE